MELEQSCNIWQSVIGNVTMVTVVMVIRNSTPTPVSTIMLAILLLIPSHHTLFKPNVGSCWQAMLTSNHENSITLLVLGY